MGRFGKFLTGWAFFLLVASATEPLAHAYIPPSIFIVKTWANKHSGIKSLKIRTTVTAFQDDKPTEAHFKETTIFNVDSMNIQSWASDDSDHKLYYVERSLNAVAPVSKILLLSDLREETRVLKERGIPVRTEDEIQSSRGDSTKGENESLARWNNAIAWMIGSPTPNGAEPNPQIWFEKDTFFPLRLIYSNPKDRDLVEFRFEGYRFSREFPYPKNMLVLRRDKKILFSSQIAELGASSSDRGNRQSRSNVPPIGFTDAGDSASSSVKDLIRSYYDLVR
jgi:hypothetical protein